LITRLPGFDVGHLLEVAITDHFSDAQRRSRGQNGNQSINGDGRTDVLITSRSGQMLVSRESLSMSTITRVKSYAVVVLPVHLVPAVGQPLQTVANLCGSESAIYAGL